MFDNLSDRLSRVFGGLQRQGTLTEQEVESAMREVRIALLEADVALPVVKSFIRSASRRATGSAVLRSISPGDLVIKIVHDELIGLLKGDDDSDADLRINNPPATILVVGLQGSGKTTSTAKIAKFLSDRNQKKVLMASLDTR
ncbi:MAG: signal recognition particle receptor subunit alpha, partial [Rhodobacteraceae bacterium]|nr:signal recognition particle receptor subunit alpha [Paracoccaceae bacterium]